ncbi:ABC transporter permease [Nocardioides aequoreus]|uniref:ABC transporter permease n=1 Tax=Nocardioides aequoreus TaxID=397278 RepID=UPI0004C32C1B|nr:ABC transporter permease [Nocardioides aequoreus]
MSTAAVTEVAPAEGVRARRLRWGALAHGQGLVGVVMVALVVVAGLLAPVLAPYDPTQQIPGANLAPPSAAHWLGTDEVNRDILSRVLHGIRIDLVVVFLAVPVGAALGVALGLLSPLHAWADVATQRLLDVLLAFPVLILAITATAAMGPGLRTIAVVIVLAELPIFGRLARTSVLKVRALPYVESARVMGAGETWLLRKHVLPNSLEPLTVQLAVSMSVAVFIEGAMSFLGLGVRPPDPSLGSLIKDGIRNVWEAPFFVVGPLVVVSMLVLGFLLVAQAISAQRRR